MSVLEAQLCGLPAIVSSKGGPKEIILDNKTGKVCSTENSQLWMDAILYFWKEKNQQPIAWVDRKSKSREYVKRNRDWKQVLPTILDIREPELCVPFLHENALTM